MMHNVFTVPYAIITYFLFTVDMWWMLVYTCVSVHIDARVEH